MNSLVKKLHKTTLKTLKSKLIKPKLEYYYCIKFLAGVKQNETISKYYQLPENDFEASGLIPTDFYLKIYKIIKQKIYEEIKENERETDEEIINQKVQIFFESIAQMNKELNKIERKSDFIDQSKGSICKTNGIKVQVFPKFERESNNEYIFTYKIEITNETEKSVQLKSRFWKIIQDSNPQSIRIVQGEGVVGEQPVIKPGQTFDYSSFCNLTHFKGSMEGYFDFVDLETENDFQVDISEFKFELKKE
eukprot:gene5545-9364_t